MNIPVLLLKRSYLQRQLAKKLAIDASNGINETQYIRIGGIEQWITIRGEDQNNPVLLFVHGGPGAVQTIFASLTRPWEKYFTVVQWDQRGAGKTLRKNGAPKSGELTLKKLEQDGIEVAEFLKSHLGKEKIVLAATSAGSTVGIAMAKHQPDLFYAYIGIDQNVGSSSNELTYQLTLKALQESGKKKDIRTLVTIGAPKKSHWTKEQYEKVTRLATKADPAVPNMVSDIIFPAMLTSPEHTFKDIGDIARGMKLSMNALYDELAAFDVRTLGLHFDIPIFIFQGDHDLIAPPAAAKEYFDSITAPYKEFVSVKNSGHLAAFTRPQEVLESLKDRVLPLVK